MNDTSARLGLPYLAPSQAQKHVTHNEALQRLDMLTQLRVQQIEATVPPAVPNEDDIYALGPAPISEWAGQGGQLACRANNGWLFIPPQQGWRAWDVAQNVLRVYGGGGWQEVTTDLQNLNGVGIGASSDATNRLSVASDATLFSHDGAGHQLKINKAAASDTAALLYQSNWTGHAETGLTGDINFNLKVSADGAVWHTSLVADAATGTVAFPSGAVVSPPRAYASTITAQPVPANTDTYVQFETSVYDTSGFYNAAQPDRFTIPEDGGYQLSTYAQIGGGFLPGDGYIIIERYNAADTKIGSYPASWITGYTPLATPLVQCVAGDYFKLLLRQNSGVDKTLLVNDDRNYLAISRVS